MVPQQVDQTDHKYFCVPLAAREQDLLEQLVDLLRDLLVLLHLGFDHFLFEDQVVRVVQLEHDQPEEFAFVRVRVVQVGVQLLQHVEQLLVGALVLTHDLLLQLLQLEFLDTLLDLLLNWDVTSQLVLLRGCVLLLVSHDLAFVLGDFGGEVGQHDVFELDHLVRDQTQNGKKVVQNQLGEVVGDHVHDPLQTVPDELELTRNLLHVQLAQLLHETDQLVQQRNDVFTLVLQEGEELFLAHQLELGEREFGLLVRGDFQQLLDYLPEDLLLDGQNVSEFLNQ